MEQPPLLRRDPQHSNLLSKPGGSSRDELINYLAAYSNELCEWAAAWCGGDERIVADYLAATSRYFSALTRRKKEEDDICCHFSARHSDSTNTHHETPSHFLLYFTRSLTDTQTQTFMAQRAKLWSHSGITCQTRRISSECPKKQLLHHPLLFTSSSVHSI